MVLIMQKTEWPYSISLNYLHANVFLHCGDVPSLKNQIKNMLQKNK
jgi:hypothetical protein